MGRLIFITGGTRSGKSTYAEGRLMDYAGALYVATARNTDPEMAERILNHQNRRPDHWRTVETDRDFFEVLSKCAEPAVLIESVGTMITNHILDAQLDWDYCSRKQVQDLQSKVLEQIEHLISGSVESGADVYVVSDEVGMGMVSAYAMGRAFSDICGLANQMLAEASHEAYLVVSGLPLKLK